MTTANWTITTGAPTVELDGTRHAAATLTVTNVSGKPDRAVVELVADDPATLPWLAVAEPQRAVPAGATAVFEVTVTVPPDAPPGPHWFAGRVNSADVAPEETSQLSDRISYTVPAQAAPPKRRRPWWPYAAAIAMILVAGTVVFLATRPGPVATPPPQPVTVPSVTGFELRDAQRSLVKSGFTDVAVQQRSTNDEGENGQVIDQSPDAGSHLSPGEQVTLVIGVWDGSSSPDTSTTPTN